MICPICRGGGKYIGSHGCFYCKGKGKVWFLRVLWNALQPIDKEEGKHRDRGSIG